MIKKNKLFFNKDATILILLRKIIPNAQLIAKHLKKTL